MAIQRESYASLLGFSAGSIEGAFLDLRGQRVLLITEEGGVFAIPLQVTELESLGAVNATTEVNIGTGTPTRNITANVDKITASQSTVSVESQNGAGHLNTMLNAKGGVSTFTYPEDAMRIRMHPGAWTVYYGDSTGKIIGDTVTWEQVLDITMTPTGHTMTLTNDFEADAMTAGTVTGDVSIITPIVQQTTASGQTTHNSNAQQATNGAAIHQQRFTNLGALAGVVYTLKGSNGAYQRVDLTVQGVYTPGILYIGGPSSTGVGVGKSPADTLDVNGRMRSTGWVPATKAAASAIEGEIFRDTDGLVKEVRAGVVRTFTTTP